MAFMFNFNVEEEDKKHCHNVDVERDVAAADQQRVTVKTFKKAQEILAQGEITLKSFNLENVIPEILSLSGGTKLHYLPSGNVNTKQKSSVSDLQDTLQSDLVPHVYEGGLKIWECSVDLVKFLAEENIKFEGSRVLELGCGAGLPGLFAAKMGAQSVHFQDYNEEVIHDVTIPNAACNQLLAQAPHQCRFFSGEWSSFQDFMMTEFNSGKFEKYDLILTSETIYCTEYYKSLHSVLQQMLKPTGQIYLAAKTYYFGVGGGTREFEEYIKQRNIFGTCVKKEINEGVKREILNIKFLPS